MTNNIFILYDYKTFEIIEFLTEFKVPKYESLFLIYTPETGKVFYADEKYLVYFNAYCI